MRDWAIWQAGAGCYSQAALSSNDSKTLYDAEMFVKGNKKRRLLHAKFIFTISKHPLDRTGVYQNRIKSLDECSHSTYISAHLRVSVHLPVGGRYDAGHDVFGGDLAAGAHLRGTLSR